MGQEEEGEPRGGGMCQLGDEGLGNMVKDWAKSRRIEPMGEDWANMGKEELVIGGGLGQQRGEFGQWEDERLDNKGMRIEPTGRRRIGLTR